MVIPLKKTSPFFTLSLKLETSLIVVIDKWFDVMDTTVDVIYMKFQRHVLEKVKLVLT